MDKLRIKRKNLYEVEVNDAGEKIVFDLEDLDLPFKLQRALDGCRAAERRMQATIDAIDAGEGIAEDGELIKGIDAAYLQARIDAFRDMRAAFDEFLGRGGCQKIFGDTNYMTMYDDLLEAFSEPQEDGKSVLEHLKINAAQIKQTIISKYGDDEKDGDLL